MTKLAMTTLHGFLGLPSDWDNLSPKAVGLNHINPFKIEINSNNMWDWAKIFNRTTPHRLLLGYSLGGRLTMHALLDNPQQWDAAVIISSHPGLSSEEEKEKRLIKTEEWASRFENEPWDSLMQNWNSQEVFSNINSFDRKEKDYQRKELAGILLNWSLGKQDNLKPQLEKLQLPILWIAGERDSTYRQIASSMNLAHPLSKVWIAPEAGHRVPWEQPLAFQKELKSFISNLGQVCDS